jgi:hypothetical protein
LFNLDLVVGGQALALGTRRADAEETDELLWQIAAYNSGIDTWTRTASL